MQTISKPPHFTRSIFDDEIFPDPDICFDSIFEPPLPGLLRSGLDLTDFCPEPPRKKIRFHLNKATKPKIQFSLADLANNYHRNENTIATILQRCDTILAERHGVGIGFVSQQTPAHDIDPLDAYDALFCTTP
jgi:hypothetical protein